MFIKIRPIFGLATLHETRTLPFPGRIRVKAGQTVNPQDVVAEALDGYQHVLIDVAQALGIHPTKAQAAILCKEGQRVEKGDILATHKGLIPRHVKAPAKAIVLLADEGKILLETARRPIRIQAGLPGTVEQIHDTLGATIKTQGALVQGLWGNGRIDTGTLMPVLESPKDVLKSDHVDISKRGMIVVGGYCKDKDLLKMAQDSTIRGLILSSLHPALISTARQMSYPIIITDGFGKHPMNTAAFKLLTTNAKRNAALFAQPFDYFRGQYPKILLDIPGMDMQPEHESAGEIAEGNRVLITSAPHEGQVGYIRKLPANKIKLPNGIKAQVAEIELDNGEKTLVPLSNLELLD